MVQGYYTLEEAAQILGMEADKLSHMAQHREIRAFADGRTWRFRIQDVEEMARRLGLGSNPDLTLGETEAAKSPSPTPKGAASPPPKGGSKPSGEEGVFDFSLAPAQDSMEIDPEIVVESGGRKSGARSPAPSPTPKAGSDSDVHLVFDVTDDFSIASDSDVKVEDSGVVKGPRSGAQGPKSGTPGAKSGAQGSKSGPQGSKSGPQGPKSGVPGAKSGPRKTSMSPDPSKSGQRKKTMMAPGARSDSGVRLIPMDEEAVSMEANMPSSATDSAVRLEKDSGSKKKDGAGAGADADDLALTTQEIDLDAELRKAAESAQGKKPKSKVKPKTDVKKGDLQMPDSGSFELADTGQELPPPPKPASPSAPTSLRSKQQGSDFELAAQDDDSDEVSLGELAPPTDVTSGVNLSGINLDKPADSGINLGKSESRNDSLEFELSLDEPDSSETKGAAPVEEVDSSGEFELTLDESGGLAPLEEEAAAEGGDKDIFETDFDMPALDEESGSEAVALDDSDTELESSDFDLSLGGGEESGSQVVALEDEEADEGAATVAAPAGRRGGVSLEEDLEAEGLDEDLMPGEGEEEPEGDEELAGGRVAVVAAAPASWGLLPGITMCFCVPVMILASMVSFELLHGMWGYKQAYKSSGILVKPLADMLGYPLPGD
jgi:excisionase family DNA binding protein